MDPHINTIPQPLDERLSIARAEIDSAPVMIEKPIERHRQGAAMTASRFLKRTSIISTLAIACIVLANMTIDIYGLFLPVKGKALPVYNNERLSKYLLSYRYIPQNFEAAIIGTSLS